ncbi:unnamed protein product [Urochloa humidicola]
MPSGSGAGRPASAATAGVRLSGARTGPGGGAREATHGRPRLPRGRRRAWPAMGQRPQVASGTGCRVAVPSGEAPALPRRSVCKRRSPSGLERFSPTRWSPDLSACQSLLPSSAASLDPSAARDTGAKLLHQSALIYAPCVLLLPACSRLPFLPLLAMPWVLQPPIPNLARSRADDSATLLVRMTSALPTASQ